MMAEEKQLVKQVDRILDEVTTPQVEVIVQMESERDTPSQLARAAGEALSRRRLSLTPRDLLPESYGEAPTKQCDTSGRRVRASRGRNPS